MTDATTEGRPRHGPWTKPAIRRIHAGLAEVRAKVGVGADGGSFS
ncbi:MAG: hypothetical protein JWO81_1570 [Alphaproteobacteria bacterium]|nr:hypothetical protein [Alphaproteobacteria bacterium]